MEKNFAYTGTDTLVAIEHALNRYNEWIVGMFIKSWGRSGGRVLDFGAGIGSLSQIFRRNAQITPETLEIDGHQRKMLEARQFSPVSSLDEVAGGIDFIFSSNVLEHIPDDVATLKLLHEKLRPGGSIAIYVPAFEAIWTSMDEKVGHYRRYTKATLSQKMRDAGFDLEHVYYADSVGFMLAYLFKFIGNKSGDVNERSLRVYDRYLLPVSRVLDTFLSPLFGKNVYAFARKR